MAGESNEATLRYAGHFTMALATIGLIGFAGLLAVPELQKINVLGTLLQKLFAVPHLGDLAKKMTEEASPQMIVGMLSLACTIVLLPGALLNWREPTLE